MNRNMAIAIVVIIALVGVAYGPTIYGLIDANVVFPWETPVTDGGGGVPGGTQYSKFSFPLYAEDTRTATASMTETVYFDTNNDGKMQASELRGVSDSSGTYTTLAEYPIGDFDIWIQSYGASYQTTYTKVHMSGDRNSDGSAKTLDTDVFIRTTDDSLTYAGLINNVAWDDSSDYNSTTNGATGNAEVIFELSAADKGLSSRVWEQVNYKQIYSDLMDISKYTYGFWLKWDQITGAVPDSAVQAPDFFGIYMTIQDKIDMGIIVGDFGLQDDDNTNWYGAAFFNDLDGDIMYNSADSPAPRPSFTFGFSGLSAAGTTIATYGVALRTGLTYSEMVSLKWTASAAYYLGTPGDDWDFTP